MWVSIIVVLLANLTSCTPQLVEYKFSGDTVVKSVDKVQADCVAGLQTSSDPLTIPFTLGQNTRIFPAIAIVLTTTAGLQTCAGSTSNNLSVIIDIKDGENTIGGMQKGVDLNIEGLQVQKYVHILPCELNAAITTTDFPQSVTLTVTARLDDTVSADIAAPGTFTAKISANSYVLNEKLTANLAYPIIFSNLITVITPYDTCGYKSTCRISIDSTAYDTAQAPDHGTAPTATGRISCEDKGKQYFNVFAVYQPKSVVLQGCLADPTSPDCGVTVTITNGEPVPSGECAIGDPSSTPVAYSTAVLLLVAVSAYAFL